jgi:hypothetical protein
VSGAVDVDVAVGDQAMEVGDAVGKFHRLACLAQLGSWCQATDLAAESPIQQPFPLLLPQPEDLADGAGARPDSGVLEGSFSVSGIGPPRSSVANRRGRKTSGWREADRYGKRIRASWATLCQEIDERGPRSGLWDDEGTKFVQRAGQETTDA